MANQTSTAQRALVQAGKTTPPVSLAAGCKGFEAEPDDPSERALGISRVSQ
jgi:hypothetical protein